MVATRAERPGDRKQERWSDGDVRMKRSKVSAMIVTAAHDRESLLCCVFISEFKA